VTHIKQPLFPSRLSGISNNSTPCSL